MCNWVLEWSTTLWPHTYFNLFMCFTVSLCSSQLSKLESSEEDSRHSWDYSAARHQDGKNFFFCQRSLIINVPYVALWKCIQWLSVRKKKGLIHHKQRIINTIFYSHYAHLIVEISISYWNFVAEVTKLCGILAVRAAEGLFPLIFFSSANRSKFSFFCLQYRTNLVSRSSTDCSFKTV